MKDIYNLSSTSLYYTSFVWSTLDNARSKMLGAVILLANDCILLHSNVFFLSDFLEAMPKRNHDRRSPEIPENHQRLSK